MERIVEFFRRLKEVIGAILFGDKGEGDAF